MGYRITYGREKRKLKIGKKFLIGAIAVIAVLSIVWRVADGVNQLPEAALESMVETVRGGGSLSDAVTAFCQEIIESAT